MHYSTEEMMFLGKKQTNYSNHNAKFMIDEDVLDSAVDITVSVFTKYLKKVFAEISKD